MNILNSILNTFFFIFFIQFFLSFFILNSLSIFTWRCSFFIQYSIYLEVKCDLSSEFIGLHSPLFEEVKIQCCFIFWCGSRFINASSCPSFTGIRWVLDSGFVRDWIQRGGSELSRCNRTSSLVFFQRRMAYYFQEVC